MTFIDKELQKLSQDIINRALGNHAALEKTNPMLERLRQAAKKLKAPRI